MVYRLTVSETKEKRRMMLGWSLRYGAVAGVLTAMVGVTIELDWGVISGVSLATSLVVIIQLYRRMVKGYRRIQGQGDWFVTVTEAGFLLEKPQKETASYMSWELLERVIMKKDMMLLVLKNGLRHFLPLESLSEEQAQALFRFCSEHAGKVVPAADQMPPPADVLTPAPMPCAAGKAARRELADVMTLQNAPRTKWVIVAVPILVSYLAILVGMWMDTGEISLFGVAVVLYLVFIALRSYLHPGWVMKKWIAGKDESYAHIRQGKVLVHTPGVAWSVIPVSLLHRARAMRHSHVYEAQGGGVLGISRSVPPPAGLPQPAPVKHWLPWLTLPASILLVPALVCLAVWQWMFPGDSGIVDEAGERGCALAAYTQSQLSPDEFPGCITWCGVYEMEDGGRAIVILWESGLELTMEMPSASAADTSEAGADSQL